FRHWRKFPRNSAREFPLICTRTRSELPRRYPENDPNGSRRKPRSPDNPLRQRRHLLAAAAALCGFSKRGHSWQHRNRFESLQNCAHLHTALYVLPGFAGNTAGAQWTFGDTERQVQELGSWFLLASLSAEGRQTLEGIFCGGVDVRGILC